MATKKFYCVNVLGTGINVTFYTEGEPKLMNFHASTYWCFIHTDGRVEYKNDFGVSSVTFHEVDPDKVQRLV